MKQGATHFKRVAILGASRGLGRCIVNGLASETSVLAASRRFSHMPEQVETVVCDFTREESRAHLHEKLMEFSPEQIIYCAGGGPFGSYGSKEWKDHLWAIQLNLIAPAEVAHWVVSRSLPTVKQLILIGSAVAEDGADANASSYAMAKHGLLGLYRSLIEETNMVDVRLYSPGYMDTDLLPPGATVRHRPLWSPDEVAEDLLSWCGSAERNTHRRLALYPSGR